MKINCFSTVLMLCILFAACQNNTNETSTDTSPTLSESSMTPVLKKTNDSKTMEKAVNQKPAIGIDISKFQGDEMTFLKTNKEGLTFVICKATEGITYTDPMFQKNWSSIPQAGFIRGAYHFYRSDDASAPQAENFSNAISNLGTSDIAPIVDFEGGGIDTSQSIQDIQTNLLAFLSKLESNTKRKPIIYTDLSTGNKYLNNEKFSEYALWIAFYSNVKEPLLPSAWKNKSWYFWQKTSDYVIDNMKNDFDVFNGDKTALIQFIEAY